MTGGASIPFIETVAIAVVSGPASWGILQHFLTRRRRKEDAEKQEERNREAVEKEHRERLKAEDDRRELLSEAQRTAQVTALESANARYTDLKTDYVECRAALVQIRDAASLLINVFESFLFKMQAAGENAETYTAVVQLSELGEARRAINEARRHLR